MSNELIFVKPESKMIGNQAGVRAKFIRKSQKRNKKTAADFMTSGWQRLETKECDK